MNPNPLDVNETPMQIRDALLVAFIIMLSLLFTVFMPSHGYDVMLRDPPRFFFDLAVFAGGTYITNFGALTGLTLYATRTKETS